MYDMMVGNTLGVADYLKLIITRHAIQRKHIFKVFLCLRYELQSMTHSNRIRFLKQSLSRINIKENIHDIDSSLLACHAKKMDVNITITCMQRIKKQAYLRVLTLDNETGFIHFSRYIISYPFYSCTCIKYFRSFTNVFDSTSVFTAKSKSSIQYSCYYHINSCYHGIIDCSYS